jgi:hypothetical protein
VTHLLIAFISKEYALRTWACHIITTPDEGNKYCILIPTSQGGDLIACRNHESFKCYILILLYAEVGKVR